MVMRASEHLSNVLGSAAFPTQRRLQRLVLVGCMLGLAVLLSGYWLSSGGGIAYIPFKSTWKHGQRSCMGSDGNLVHSGPIGHWLSNETYPLPFAGSYEDLGLPQTWTTFVERYEPYNLDGDDFDSVNSINTTRSVINWADLQFQCFMQNAHRFAFPNDDAMGLRNGMVRLNYKNKTSVASLYPSPSAFNATGRTAIVLRAYSGYKYLQEDLSHIRSLIVETSLRTGGKYQVILLVDSHHAVDQDVFTSPASYRRAMDKAGIPQEFRNIAILWDEALLRDWYDKVTEHSTFFQVYQPLQLFALHYPEFDHYWQLELDMRFLGDAGQYLDALSDFARREPRKQALERSTFLHMQAAVGRYDQLRDSVNNITGGDSWAWGPVAIPDIIPVGPKPPVINPHNDDFSWGMGEDADLIVTSYCMNATNSPHWFFMDWIHGFALNQSTPRFLCPPAVTRTSRTLLLAMHDAQLRHGLALPSEATPISFALYHGLKISFPPQPLFWHIEDDATTRQGWWKGGPAMSAAGVGAKNTSHPSGNGLSFWWSSSWPRQIMDAWRNGTIDQGVEWPWILRHHDGRVYAPNILLHPVKHAKTS